VSIYDEPEPYVSPGQRRLRNAVRATLAVVVVFLLAIASLFVARVGSEAIMGQCAPPWLTGADPQLCLNAQISRGQLIVSGTTSLSDGAVIQLWAEDYGTAFGDHWQTDTAVVTVTNGRFRTTFDLSGWGAGTVTAHAQFRVGPGQPLEVVDRYGPNGERIVGPDVELDFRAGDPPPRTVQVSVDVDLPAS
jgi:hypothetical protein